MPEVHKVLVVYVLVVHMHEDDAKLTDLKDMLKSKDIEIKGKDIQIYSLSITTAKLNNARNPDYVRELLKPRIEWADKIIVLITPDTQSHEWVYWVVHYAEELDKFVIGVWGYGSAVCELPDALNKYADALVGWNTDSILQALEGKRLWQNPDCTQRETQPISRIGCN